jgi:hypothetical protein
MVGEVIGLRADIVWVKDSRRMAKLLLGVVWVVAVHFRVVKKFYYRIIMRLESGKN